MWTPSPCLQIEYITTEPSALLHHGGRQKHKPLSHCREKLSWRRKRDLNPFKCFLTHILAIELIGVAPFIRRRWTETRNEGAEAKERSPVTTTGCREPGHQESIPGGGVALFGTSPVSCWFRQDPDQADSKEEWSTDAFRSYQHCGALLVPFSHHSANAQHQQGEFPLLKHCCYSWVSPSLHHNIANGVNGDLSEGKGF